MGRCCLFDNLPDEFDDTSVADPHRDRPFLREGSMTALQEPSVWDVERWPNDVRRVMSWLDCQPPVGGERRRSARTRYRVRAAIGMFAGTGHEAMIIPIYARDASVHAMGFITSAEVPIGND